MGAPVSLFESGAILLYLAEKTGKFIAKDLRGRAETPAVAVLADGGARAHGGAEPPFLRLCAGEDPPTRSTAMCGETNRLYAVLDKRLADREFMAGPYSIADMASYPWTVYYERQGQKLEDFPNLKRWFQAIQARPAVVRAYEKAKGVNNPNPGIQTEEQRAHPVSASRRRRSACREGGRGRTPRRSYLNVLDHLDDRRPDQHDEEGRQNEQDHRHGHDRRQARRFLFRPHSCARRGTRSPARGASGARGVP